MKLTTKNEWRPISLELVRDGFYARIVLGYAYGHERWRWSVTPLELVERYYSKPVEGAYARGYSRSREKAVRMAEAAIVALGKTR